MGGRLNEMTFYLQSLTCRRYVRLGNACLMAPSPYMKVQGWQFITGLVNILFLALVFLWGVLDPYSMNLQVTPEPRTPNDVLAAGTEGSTTHPRPAPRSES